VATELEGPAMDTLINAFRAVARKDHPDWDEYRAAMISEQRQILRLQPASAVGQING